MGWGKFKTELKDLMGFMGLDLGFFNGMTNMEKRICKKMKIERMEEKEESKSRIR